VELFSDFRALTLKNSIIQYGLELGLYTSFEEMCKQYEYEFGAFLPNQSLLGKHITINDGVPAESDWINKIHRYVDIDMTSLSFLSDHITSLSNSVNEDMLSKTSMIKALTAELNVRIIAMKNSMSNSIGNASMRSLLGEDISAADSNIVYKNSTISSGVNFNKITRINDNIVNSYFTKVGDSNIVGVTNIDNVIDKANVKIQVREGASSGSVAMYIKLSEKFLVNNIRFNTNDKVGIAVKAVVGGDLISLSPQRRYTNDVDISFKPTVTDTLVLEIVSTSITNNTSDTFDEFNFSLIDFVLYSNKYKEVSVYESNILTLPEKYNKVSLVGDQKINPNTSIDAYISTDDKSSWKPINIYHPIVVTHGKMINTIESLTKDPYVDTIDTAIISEDIKNDTFALSSTIDDVEYIKQLDFYVLRNTNNSFFLVTDAVIYVQDDIPNFDFDTYPCTIANQVMSQGDIIYAGTHSIHYEAGLSGLLTYLTGHSIVIGTELQRYVNDMEDIKTNEFSITNNGTDDYIVIKRMNSSDWEDEEFLVIKNDIQTIDLGNMPDTIAVRIILHSDGEERPFISKLGVITL